jgi:hypothetical protein
VPDWPFDNRGFWSEGIEAQFIFYNPNDLAKVATKNMAAYEPQPYAVMTLDSYLFDGSSIDFERGKKHLLGAMAFDRANGLIYVMERRADEEKSLVHVFKINPGQNLYFRDNDQDGYGDPGSPLEASSQPSGFVSDNTDCNDLDDDIHPGSTEIFNSMDDNCDGIIDNIVPDKVTLISASGTSDDIAQTFTWNEDPYSTWYKLFIWDSSEKTVHTHWYGAAKVCSEGICSVSLESALLVGEYEWFVKSWNDYGSIWTDGMAVTIQSNDTPPSKVIHTSPSYQTQNPTPSFTWQADPNSTWYRLWVGYPGDQKIFAQWYAAKDICSGDNCSVITGTELMDGEYEWYIKSWNEFGRVWSDGMSFTVFLSFLF